MTGFRIPTVRGLMAQWYRQRKRRPGAVWLRRVHAAVLVLALTTGLTLAGTGAASAIPPFNDCKSPPMPTDPAAGFLSTLDQLVVHEPIAGEVPSDAAEVQGKLITYYGYAGMQWSNYDLGCGGGVRDPGASVDTMFGNFFLWIARALFAAQQGLQELVVMDPTGGDVADASDTTARALFDAVFSPWAGAALVLAGSIVIVAGRRGDVGEVLTRVCLILAAIAVSALSFGSGAQLSEDLSGAVRQVLQDARQSVAQQAFPEQGESAGQAMRDAVYQQIIYRSWKDGQVGAYGRDDIAWQLFQNQALDYNEWWAILDGQVDQEDAYREKGERWMEVADQEATPAEYTNLQGKGDGRTATGLGAVLIMAPIAIVQIFALMIQYMLVLFLAFLPIGAPLVALLAIVRPGTLEKSIKVVGAVIFGGLVASVCGIAHSIVILTMAGNGDLTDGSMIVASWATTLILLKLLRPIVSLTGIFSSTRAMAGQFSRRAARAHQWVKTEVRHHETNRATSRRHQQLIGALRGRARGGVTGGQEADGPDDPGPGRRPPGPPGSGPRPPDPRPPGPRGGGSDGGDAPTGPIGIGPRPGPSGPIIRGGAGGREPVPEAVGSVGRPRHGTVDVSRRRPDVRGGEAPDRGPEPSTFATRPDGRRVPRSGQIGQDPVGSAPVGGGPRDGNTSRAHAGAVGGPAAARLARTSTTRRRGPGFYRPSRTRTADRPHTGTAVGPRPEFGRVRPW